MPGAGCSSPQWTLHTCHSTAPSPPHIHGTSLHGHAILAAAPLCDRSFHTGSGASAGQAACEEQKQEKWTKGWTQTRNRSGNATAPSASWRNISRCQHFLPLTLFCVTKGNTKVWDTQQLFHSWFPWATHDIQCISLSFATSQHTVQQLLRVKMFFKKRPLIL